MPPRKASKSKNTPATDAQIQDYRHAEKCKNIPSAGLALQGKVRETPKVRYEYDAHLPPVLRFDNIGKSDRLSEMIAAARTCPLTEEESTLLAEALCKREPQTRHRPRTIRRLQRNEVIAFYRWEEWKNRGQGD